MKDFRVLLIATDPVLPTDKAVRGAIETLASNLEKAGVNVVRESPLLPDFAASSRLYMRMLLSFLGGTFPQESYDGAKAAAAKGDPGIGPVYDSVFSSAAKTSVRCGRVDFPTPRSAHKKKQSKRVRN